MDTTSKKRLREFLPHFEKKEKATYVKDGFMKRLESEMYEHDLFVDQYTSRLDELGGWDILEDTQFARACDIDACWVLMTAAIRSERMSMEEGYVWQGYIDNGLFEVLLNRIVSVEETV